MTKKIKVIAILLSIALIVGTAGCGKSKTSKSKEKQKTQGDSTLASNASSTAASGNVPATTGKPEDTQVKMPTLSDEYGRDDPFIPLAGSSGGKTAALVNPPPKQPVVKKIEEDIGSDINPHIVVVPKKIDLPNVRLTLAIDGSTAIFEENKSSKVASVGDTISGMKVLEIRNNEAVLGSGTKKYIVTTEGIREETPTKKANIPQKTKIKKR